MNTLFKKISLGAAVVAVVLSMVGSVTATHTDIAKAVITDEQLGLSYGAATGLVGTDIRFTAARIIQVSLTLLGIVALVIVVYAGFTWMTAGGNEEKITEAKAWLTASIIGLAIILSAYSITSFIISRLITATQVN